LVEFVFVEGVFQVGFNVFDRFDGLLAEGEYVIFELVNGVFYVGMEAGAFFDQRDGAF
jgi:uncharacterized membrane protein YciS (DUF1049 family)